MQLDGHPSEDVVHIQIRLPRQNRAEVHFHLEASDGIAYLEQGEAPDLGVVHTPPDFVDEVLDWLEKLGPGLQVEVLGLSNTSKA